MSTNDISGQEATAAQLPPAIGVDAHGLVHHVREQFATEVIITDGDETVARRDLEGRDRSAWVAYVEAERGWRATWASERLTPAEIDRRIAEVR